MIADNNALLDEQEHQPRITYSDLAHKPVWSFADLCLATDTPLSTLNAIVEETPIDGAFLMGRRRRVTREDALSWIESLRKKYPWVPRKNVRRAAK